MIESQNITIRRAHERDLEAWLALRLQLWPDAVGDEELVEMRASLTRDDNVVLLAEAPDGRIIGFLEGAIRSVAEGCKGAAGYIEGWFVTEDWRCCGIGRLLVEAAEAWAKSKGCREMASDCLLENEVSFNAHLLLGYEEVERSIHFRKEI